MWLKGWMILFSAYTVGALHALHPAHWFPIVVVSRARKWNRIQTVLGAWIAGSGHVVFSVGVLFFLAWAGKEVFEGWASWFEMWTGWVLIVFGLGYVALSLFHHHHHKHEIKKRNIQTHPFLFLFLMGLSPCVSALPVLLSALPLGWNGVVGAAMCFSLGVWTAEIVASLLVVHGISLLKWKYFEFLSDPIAGGMIVLLGVVFLFLGHHH